MSLTVVIEMALIRAEDQVLPALSRTCFMISMLCPQIHLGLRGPSQVPHRTLWSMGSHFSQMSPSGVTSALHRVHTLTHICTTPPQNMCHISARNYTTHMLPFIYTNTYMNICRIFFVICAKKKATCEVQFLSRFVFLFYSELKTT